MIARALPLILVALLSASGARALEYDSEVEKPLRQQLEDDLAFLASMRGSAETPLHKEIFGKFDGKGYRKWFDARVEYVGKNLCMTDGAVACVLSAWDGWIFLSPNYTKFSHPQIARLSVLLHEARHAENGGDWPHAKCPKPYLDDAGRDVRSLWTGELLEREYACDYTVYGSYGAQAIFLKNVAANCSNCTDKVKADAEIYGDDLVKRITDASAKAKIKKDLSLP